MLDLLTIGSPEERTELVSDMMKDNKISPPVRPSGSLKTAWLALVSWQS